MPEVISTVVRSWLVGSPILGTKEALESDASLISRAYVRRAAPPVAVMIGISTTSLVSVVKEFLTGARVGLCGLT